MLFIIKNVIYAVNEVLKRTILIVRGVNDHCS